jgi:uncharacterized protein (DUF2235 family)
MKRIVVLIDGTWNKEGTAGNTNVVTLDIAHRIAANAFIKAEATDGIAQHVHYHDGVAPRAISSRDSWAEPSVSGSNKL